MAKMTDACDTAVRTMATRAVAHGTRTKFRTSAYREKSALSNAHQRRL